MRQILEDIDDLLLEGRYNLPPVVTAYHCGRELDGGSFSLSYAGSGEGMQALGPGIYFATEEPVAELYCKYARDPYMYTVEIPTKGLYYAQQGVPEHFREPLKALRDDLIDKHGEYDKLWGEYRLPSARELQYGPGYIGRIFKLLGPKKTISLLGEIGIDGLYAKLGAYAGGAFEIAVYDPSIIRIVDVSPVSSQD